MKNRILVSLLAAATISSAPMLAEHKTAQNQCAITEKHCILRRSMDRLWTDHVVWTRLFIISALEGLPDLDATTARLLENPKALGHAFAAFYGANVGAQITKLLTDHLLLITDLVKALKANNKKAAQQTDKKLHANVVEIATALNKSKLDKSKDLLVDMLNKHVALTLQEITARLNKKWKDDVKIFDQLLNQVLDMSKALSDGIKKQFPDKFAQ